MDMHVCYCSDDHEKVVEHYLDPQFMGHTQSENFFKSIKVSLSPLVPNKLLQIPIDGPSIFYFRLFGDDRTKEAPDIRGFIKLETLGLHMVHGSFQQGEMKIGRKL